MTRRRIGNARGAALVAVLLALAGWEPFRSPDPDIERGNRAFAEKRWDDAIAAYEKARGGELDERAIDYNVGTARQRKAEALPPGDDRTRLEREAMEALTRGGTAKDPAIAGQAQYNLGNLLLGANQLDEAIAAYKQALRLDPGLDDARVNLEMAMRRRQKQQPPPQQGQSGGQGQGQGQGGGGQQGQPGPPRDPQGPPQDPQGPPQGQSQDQGQGPAGPQGGPGQSPPDSSGPPASGPSQRGRGPTPRPDRAPMDNELDRLERSSRELRREQLRRRQGERGRSSSGPDW